MPPFLRRWLSSYRSDELASRVGLAFWLQVSGTGLAYGLQVVLARWLGAAEYGLYTFILAWATLLALVSGLGFPTAVLRFIPEYLAAKDGRHLRGLLRRSRQMVGAVSLVLAVAGTLAVEVLSRAELLERPAPWRVGLWLVPLLALLGLYAETARALHRIALAYAPTRLLVPVLLIAGGGVGLALHPPLTSTSVLAVSGIAYLAAGALQALLVRRSLSTPTPDAVPFYQTRAWLEVSLPMLLITGFLIILNRVDVLMLGALVDPEAVGPYNVASRTASLVTFTLTAINTVVAPMFSAHHARGARADLQALLARTVRWSFWSSAGTALGLSLLAEPVLGLFGPEFVAARGVMLVLLAGHVVSASVGSAGYLLNMTGQQNRTAVVYGVSALINVVLNVGGILWLGALGAALATALSMMLWNLWLYRIVVKTLGLYPDFFSTLTKRDP